MFTEEEFKKCRSLLCNRRIRSKSDFKQWALLRHPDKVAPSEQATATRNFQDVLNCYQELILREDQKLLDCSSDSRRLYEQYIQSQQEETIFRQKRPKFEEESTDSIQLLVRIVPYMRSPKKTKSVILEVPSQINIPELALLVAKKIPRDWPNIGVTARERAEHIIKHGMFIVSSGDIPSVIQLKDIFEDIIPDFPEMTLEIFETKTQKFKPQTRRRSQFFVD